MSDAMPEFFKVVVYLGSKLPQPPVWVRATSRDDARDQVLELVNYGSEWWELSTPADGIRLYVYAGPAAEPTIYPSGTDHPRSAMR